MPGDPLSPFPFITRDMLRFGQTAKLELRVDMQADTAANLSISGITREGSFTYKATTPSNSLNTSISFGLSDIPIMVSVKDTVGVLEQGMAFVTLSLVVNGDIVQQLTSGYVYNQKSISWPQTQQVDLRPGGGKLTAAQSAAVGAGATPQITVPAGEVWKIKSANVALTTSATVASRYPYIEFSPAAGGLIEGITSGNQIASLVYTWVFANYGADVIGSANNLYLVPFPSEISLAAGSTIIFKAGNLQANDQFGIATVQFEKYFKTN